MPKLRDYARSHFVALICPLHRFDRGPSFPHHHPAVSTPTSRWVTTDADRQTLRLIVIAIVLLRTAAALPISAARRLKSSERVCSGGLTVTSPLNTSPCVRSLPLSTAELRAENGTEVLNHASLDSVTDVFVPWLRESYCSVI